MNSQHTRINFTIEQEQNRELPFLDTVVKVESDGNLSTRIYSKKTHTNQYLNFGSNHHLSQKVGIVSTLMKRLELVSKEEDKDAEISILQGAFRACNTVAQR